MPLNVAATNLEAWPRNASEAIALQHDLKDRVQLLPGPHAVSSICGLDVGYDPSTNRSFAAGVMFDAASLRPTTAARAELPTEFPYIPGLLSFREIPVLLEVLKQLPKPDLLMVDGQGIAHPRRLGIASHLGVLMDLPTIGVAKSKLCGWYKALPDRVGATVPLMDGKEQIGTVLRSKRGCLPLFISPGHRTDQASALDWVLRCLKGYRLPEPTRIADKHSKKESRAPDLLLF